MISILKSTSQHIKDHSIFFVFLQLAYCPLISIPFHLWLALVPTNRHSFFFYFYFFQESRSFHDWSLLFAFHFLIFPLNNDVIDEKLIGFLRNLVIYIYSQNSKQNIGSNFLLMFTINIIFFFLIFFLLSNYSKTKIIREK